MKNLIFVLLLLIGQTAQATTSCAELFKHKTALDEIVHLSPRNRIPMIIRGNEKLNKTPARPVADTQPVRDLKRKNVTIVGGGMAGLTAAYELMKRGISVTLIEKSDELGGLAAGGTRAGIEYDRGTAYFSEIIPEQQRIYNELGLKDYIEKSKIKSPSDSLYWDDAPLLTNGKKKVLYRDFWEHLPTLRELPASFELFKWTLELYEKRQMIPNQPFEDARYLALDYMIWADVIKNMPTVLEQYVIENPTDRAAKILWNRFKRDLKAGRLDPKNPMEAVLRKADNYARSALGSDPYHVNAAAAANFELSETRHRFTYKVGTGEVANRLLQKLKERPDLVTLRANSEVESVNETSNGVDVVYIKDGQRFLTRADRLIYSAPLTTAPQVIKNFDRIAPEHYSIIKDFVEREQITDYNVFVVFVEGHPTANKMTYDLWPILKDYTHKDPTDFISGRWQEFEGFKLAPKPGDNTDVISIYHPAGPSRKYTDQELMEIAEHSVAYMKRPYDPIQKANGEPEINVKLVEVNHWSKSILTPRPGHFTQARKLREVVGERIRLAQSGIGTPSHEEAQYRGLRSAIETAQDLVKSGVVSKARRRSAVSEPKPKKPKKAS